MLTQFERDANLSDLMDYQARTRPDAEMLVFNDERYSWGQGDRIINRVANGLIALGIGRNDKVAILADTSAEYFFTFWGIIRAGACAVPLLPATVSRRADLRAATVRSAPGTQRPPIS